MRRDRREGDSMEKSNTAKMIELLRRLKTEMNGAVVGGMEDRGVNYALSYGVSVPTIRRIAREYAPDHALAEFLFQQDIREMKIAAVYVDIPDDVTREQMDRWAAVMTPELMEHAATGLFYAAPVAAEMLRVWLASGNQLRVKGALHMAGRRVAGQLADKDECAELLPAIECAILSGTGMVRQPAVYALLKIGGCSESLKERVAAVCDRLRAEGNTVAVDVADETAALLEIG